MIIDFQKKITPYLDGSLSREDKSEFEAFVSTHPEFESQIQNRQNELSLLRSMLPAAQLTSEARESLESELKLSVFNLLKEEPRNMMDRVKSNFEEWFNR
jgi:anti-sigma-K factor RskA